jgi:hypothetical protein
MNKKLDEIDDNLFTWTHLRIFKLLSLVSRKKKAFYKYNFFVTLETAILFGVKTARTVWYLSKTKRFCMMGRTLFHKKIYSSWNKYVGQAMVSWSVIYCFTLRPRIFHFYGDVTITVNSCKNLGLCSALRSSEQGRIFIVPHPLRHGSSVFLISSEWPSHSVADYDKHGDMENLF